MVQTNKVYAGYDSPTPAPTLNNSFREIANSISEFVQTIISKMVSALEVDANSPTSQAIKNFEIWTQGREESVPGPEHNLENVSYYRGRSESSKPLVKDPNRLKDEDAREARRSRKEQIKYEEHLFRMSELTDYNDGSDTKKSSASLFAPFEDLLNSIRECFASALTVDDEIAILEKSRARDLL